MAGFKSEWVADFRRNPHADLGLSTIVVTAYELSEALLATIVREFGGSVLDIETARRGLALTAEALVMAHMREVAKRGQ